MNRHSTIILTALTLSSLFSIPCRASTAPDNCNCRPPKPPQEAFDACKEKKSGDEVQITTPDGETIKAVCREMGAELAAVPKGVRPPPRHGAPSAKGDQPEVSGSTGE